MADKRKKEDCMIQATANMECAYRALMAAGQELLPFDDELKRLNRIRKSVRELEIDMMHQAVLLHDMNGKE